ncbi:uncharacterized protein LOC117120778 isoform X2 [Anneissia japonica]|uniref:uncharacterized protein LOC117120778 isoform X2 n=1 Tax=Anneissia japonica TaxID=1529436 RepID=UPI0014257520|nr:uncharacterized protein LOC117120778 isoform X2 [Anneissia japonica]
MRLNWKRIDLSKINLSSVSGRTLACLIKISPDISHIDMSYCSLSGIIVNEMMEECGRMNIVLKDNMLELKGNDLSDIDGKSLVELVRVIHSPYDKRYGAIEPFRWSDYSLSADNLQRLVESGVNMRLNRKWIDLSKINLSSVSGRTLACLIKISPDMSHIDMSYCSLSVSIVNEMMEECGRMNIVLKDNMLELKGNDLSDIDGKSLVELVRVIHPPHEELYGATKPFRWSDYFLSADNLQRLVESGVNMRLNGKCIDLSKINLSSVSGRTLACLIKISPDTSHIDMSFCSLSGIIVNEMMEECGRMNIVLKDNMLELKGNDLSDIDGKSLVELVRVIHPPYDKHYGAIEPFRWSDYALSADNLQRLVESGVNMRLNGKWIDLSKINLSSVSGRTLACLFKIFPNLSVFDMSYCSLSSSIVTEMMEECGRMNVVLKNNMLELEGNDLSCIDGKSLAELVRVVTPYGGTFTWSDYALSADNLQRLVESGVNMRLHWKRIDLSKINLSSVSGRTLAFLFKISPDLSHIDMSYCSLSDIIVNEMIEECGRMNIVLEDNMLGLKGNDLSCIDGKSLAELIGVIIQPYDDDDDDDKTFQME